MKIPLYGKRGQGKVTLIDECDAWVARWQWQVNDHGYVFRNSVQPRDKVTKRRRTRKITLHKVILPVEPGMQVDHVNGDKLDNRRSNLRPATQSLNNANSKKRKSAIPFRGVRSDRGRISAQIRVNGKQIHLGRFTTPEEAARAYDHAASMWFGEFARLNFPLTR